MHKITSKLSVSLSIATALFLGSNTVAIAQLAENWNVVPHQRAEARNSVGMTLLNRRRVEAACELFRLASVEDPTNAVSYGSLGIALAMQGRYQEALDSLQKSYQLRQSSEILLSTGIVYYLMNDYDAAINAWTKVLETNPKAANVYGPMGMAFLRKGDFAQAEQFLDKLVKFAPHSGFGYHALALSKYLQGDFRASRASAERAEQIYPYPPTVLLLAKLDFLQGYKLRGLKRAQQFNQQVRSKIWPQRSMTEFGYPIQHDAHWDPFLADTFDNGYLLMARIADLPKEDNRRRSLARAGKAALFMDEIRRKLTEHPTDYFLIRELGLMEFAAGDYSGAADSSQKVLDLCPKCSVELLHLAKALALGGKTSEAMASVKRFQSLYPNEALAPAFTTLDQVAAPVQGATGGDSSGVSTGNTRSYQRTTREDKTFRRPVNAPEIVPRSNDRPPTLSPNSTGSDASSGFTNQTSPEAGPISTPVLPQGASNPALVAPPATTPTPSIPASEF